MQKSEPASAKYGARARPYACSLALSMEPTTMGTIVNRRPFMI
jgi:hypothetical protein